MKKRIIALAAAAGILTAVHIGGGIGFWYATKNVSRKPPKTEEERREREKTEREKEALFSLKPEEVERTSFDGLKLHGLYLPPEKPSKRFVICVHGYRETGPDRYGRMVPFYHEKLGYHMLIPDDRAHGKSEGKYIGFGWPDHQDVLQWADYLVQRFGEDIEIILHGVSMGASTVLMVNGDNPPPQVKLIVEDCGYCNAMEQVRHFIQIKLHLEGTVITWVASRFSSVLARYSFEQADCLKSLKTARCPVLFIHGEADDYVPFSMGKRLYEACQCVPKDFLWVPGAPHARSYQMDQDGYEKKVEEFIAKHLGRL